MLALVILETSIKEAMRYPVGNDEEAAALAAPVNCDSRVVSTKTLKVMRSAGGGGMQSISNTSCPAEICDCGFSLGLKVQVPATRAPRPTRIRMKLLQVARMAEMSPFE